MRADRDGAATSAEELADEVELHLRRASLPERAEGARRYLKSDLEHLGVSVPAVRKIAQGVHRGHPDMSRADRLRLIEALWAKRVHERRLLAVEMLDLASAELSAADAPLLERLLREARTWALVDPLAINVVGALVERETLAWDPLLRRWARDGERWLQRASLLAHLPALRAGRGDFGRFGELADALLDERDPFIRKAVGWVLRDTGRRRPDLVTAWLFPRATSAAGLTVREAVKHLPQSDRQRILDAHSHARPPGIYT